MEYRMPAEWEPHEGTWIAWPHEKTDWPGEFTPVPWVYCEIVRRLARVERVHILIEHRDAQAKAAKMLRTAGVDLDAVDFFVCPTNRSWTRDYCPIFVKDALGSVVLLNWRFNGWAKYDNWKIDDAVPSKIARRYKLPVVEPDLNGRRIVLEGG